MSSMSGFLTYLAGTIPEFIVWISALAFLLMTWKRGSRPRLLALGALLVELATTPLFAGVYLVLPHLASSRGEMSGSKLGLLYQLAGLCHSLIAAAAWALVLFAFFTALKAEEPPLPRNAAVGEPLE